MFDESLVEVPGGTLVRLPELSARLAVGEKGQVSCGYLYRWIGVHNLVKDILPQPVGSVTGILGFLLGGTRPSDRDTVISVKHTVLAVAWLAINQSVGPHAVFTPCEDNAQMFPALPGGSSGEATSATVLVRGGPWQTHDNYAKSRGSYARR